MKQKLRKTKDGSIWSLNSVTAFVIGEYRNDFACQWYNYDDRVCLSWSHLSLDVA